MERSNIRNPRLFWRHVEYLIYEAKDVLPDNEFIIMAEASAPSVSFLIPPATTLYTSVILITYFYLFLCCHVIHPHLLRHHNKHESCRLLRNHNTGYGLPNLCSYLQTYLRKLHRFLSLFVLSLPFSHLIHITTYYYIYLSLKQKHKILCHYIISSEAA